MAAANLPPNGGGDGKEPGTLSPEEREAFKKRADELGRRLEAAKSPGGPPSKGAADGTGAAKNNEAFGRAMRVSTELIGGIVVGAGLGWLIDRAMNTWPAFFIVFFLLGSAAGMINVVRAGTSMKTGRMNPKAGPSVRDDDET